MKKKSEKKVINVTAWIALALSLISLLIDVLQFHYTKSQDKVLVDLDCRALDKLMSVSDDSPGLMIHVPVKCTLKNLGRKPIGIENIYPIFYKKDTEITLDRGIDDVNDIHISSFIPGDEYRFKNKLIIPEQIREGVVFSFETESLIPIVFSLKESEKNQEEAMKNCFLDKVDRVEQISCFNSVEGKSLVNYLYEGARFPAHHIGHDYTNGIGIAITFFDDTRVADEVDIRANSPFKENEESDVLGGNYFSSYPIEPLLNE